MLHHNVVLAQAEHDKQSCNSKHAYTHIYIMQHRAYASWAHAYLQKKRVHKHMHCTRAPLHGHAMQPQSISPSYQVETERLAFRQQENSITTSFQAARNLRTRPTPPTTQLQLHRQIGNKSPSKIEVTTIESRAKKRWQHLRAEQNVGDDFRES